MTLPFAALLFLAAMLAGALNSVAGGGSFISFPALIYTGVPEINANITNTVALWPGSIASAGAYRNEFAAQKRTLVVLVAVSLLGGIAGAILLLRTPQSTFTHLLPFLLLLATLLFTFGGALTRRLRASVERAKFPVWFIGLSVALLQFIVAVYGGYFGGGIGIMMLAILALMGMENIHTMNALKTVLATCINGVAVVAFIIAGAILWPQAIVMIMGAIVGGYGGAHYARQIDPKLIRRFVVVVGFTMTIYFFWRSFHS